MTVISWREGSLQRALHNELCHSGVLPRSSRYNNIACMGRDHCNLGVCNALVYFEPRTRRNVSAV